MEIADRMVLHTDPSQELMDAFSIFDMYASLARGGADGAAMARV